MKLNLWVPFMLFSSLLAAKPLMADDTIANIVEEAGPSVVNIVSRKNLRMPSVRRVPGYYDYYYVNPNNIIPQKGEGSGFIYDANGFVLTNHHVIEGADEILINMHDGRQYRAVLHGGDPRRDIAILKIEDRNFSGFDASEVARLGDSNDLRVGQWVIAIGSPFSLDKTVTVGIVSAKGRKLSADEDADYSNLIQTDASINPGNSGGPLLNLKGEVIGINTAINAAGQGLGFAIPINLARRVTSDLAQFGRVRRSWLGVEMSGVDQESYRYLGLKSPRGVVIRRVVAKTPAERAGLQPGDVILKMNGTLIEDPSILIEKIQEVPVGEEARLLIVRKGEEMTLMVRLEEMGHKVKAEIPVSGDLGVKAKTLRPEDIQKFSLHQGTEGVLLEKVRPGLKGWTLGLRNGDIVVQLDRRSIQSAEDFYAGMDGLQKDGNHLLVLIRDGYLTYLEI